MKDYKGGQGSSLQGTNVWYLERSEMLCLCNSGKDKTENWNINEWILRNVSIESVNTFFWVYRGNTRNNKNSPSVSKGLSYTSHIYWYTYLMLIINQAYLTQYTYSTLQNYQISRLVIRKPVS